MAYPIEKLAERWAQAKTLRQPWESVWQECYDYGLPGRRGFANRGIDTEAFDRLFDTTAVEALGEFSNNLQAGLTAPMAKSLELVPDVELDDDQRHQVQEELDKIRDVILQALDDAGADIADPETFSETGCVGGGFQLLPELPGQWPPFKIMTIPASQVWLLPGPYGQPDGWARCNYARFSELKIEYPNAAWGKITKGKSQQDLEALELEVVECVYRDWEYPKETWCYQLFLPKDQVELERATYVGYGSNPWAMARWTGAAGDLYGRPPMLAALPLAKSLNLAVEMTLENAELALAGLWQYEGSDVINANQIQLIPGSIIPKVPGTEGLSPLQFQGRFDVSQMLLSDMRAQVRATFFNEDYGPTDKTPMSAEEVRARKARSLRRMGASYLRLRSEFVERRAHRVLYLLVKNKFVEVPTLPHELIRIRVVSPLQRTVSMESVERVSGYIGTIASLYGPKMALLLSNPAEVADKMREAFQVPASLVPTPGVVRQQIQQMLGGVAEAQQTAPGAADPLINAVTAALPKS